MVVTKARILPDLAALQARIKELEEQNQALNAKANKDTTVEIQDYKGKPVLYFTGNFKPFHAGMSKLKVFTECEKQIKTFLASEGKKI